LQKSVNDVVCRLPFLSGRLKPKFFSYHHELLSSPPQVVCMGDTYTFTDYYNKGEKHVLRVLYGERHITVEVIHSIVDGRGLSKVMQALLIRYFELMGVDFEKTDMINCADKFQSEEWEDAYLRFYAPSKEKSSRVTKKHTESYHHKVPKPKPIHVTLKSFKFSEIKQAAKTHNATISEYVTAQLFLAIAKEREVNKSNKAITMLVPIDCRTFFPTKTLRSFVDSITITMPETDDFAVMITEIREQYAKITTEFIQANINEFQCLVHIALFLLLVVKKLLLRNFEDS